MFTGLVQSLGTVSSVRPDGAGGLAAAYATMLDNATARSRAKTLGREKVAGFSGVRMADEMRSLFEKNYFTHND